MLFHFKVYSDKPEKRGIFDRLELESNGHQQYETINLVGTETRIKVTGLDKPASSVFARLGGIQSNQRLEVLSDASRSLSAIHRQTVAKV